MTSAGGQAGSPLVSIGIPTYERQSTLARAIESARAQTYANLEIVISDNASRDGTEALCRAVEAEDSRVRYQRRAHNQGPTINFNALFETCRGDYVMMLADDDWLDREYVSRCLAALCADPEAALVAGLAHYVRGDAFVHEGVRHAHLEPDPAVRVRGYLRAVSDNGVFYGLMPRAVVQRASPLPNVLGNDWLYLARIAYQGPIHTLPDVRIHRELGGTSADVSSILSTFGRSRWQARVPQLMIASELVRDIGWGHPVYAPLGRRRRLTLAVAAAAASMRWRALAWHLATPSFAGLAGRPRGRAVYQAYDRVTRALGAGRQP